MKATKKKKTHWKPILLKWTGAIQIEKPQNHEKCHDAEKKRFNGKMVMIITAAVAAFGHLLLFNQWKYFRFTTKRSETINWPHSPCPFFHRLYKSSSSFFFVPSMNYTATYFSMLLIVSSWRMLMNYFFCRCFKIWK